MSELKTEMGLRIKFQRKKLGLTQENLAEELCVSVKHLSEVERGLSGLSIENLVLLSNTLGVTLDYLVKGAEETESDRIISMIQEIPDSKKPLLMELFRIGIKLSIK